MSNVKRIHGKKASNVLIMCLLILSIISLSILLPGGTIIVKAAIQATYYVAPDGSDSNPGTLTQPFATIQKARDVVSTINSDMTGDIYVYIKQGTYYITSTVVFDDTDSGTNGYKMPGLSPEGSPDER